MRDVDKKELAEEFPENKKFSRLVGETRGDFQIRIF